LESSGQNTTKWTDQDIKLLAKTVQHFATNLELISDTIKQRSVSQIRGALQKKAFDAAGIIVHTQPQPIIESPQSRVHLGTNQNQNANVTLAALNASESEVDVEDIGPPTDSSLDFNE